jgi:hypothetical protein
MGSLATKASGLAGRGSPCNKEAIRPSVFTPAFTPRRQDENEIVGRGDKNLLYAAVFLMGDPGLEPGTSSLSEKRSNRLS